MTHREFSLKLNRWLEFAKYNRIRKFDAWPIWFQFARYAGIDIKPLFFWDNSAILSYYIGIFFFSFCFIAQYFTRNFLWNATVVHWDNVLITLGLACPMGILLWYNIFLKKRKLNLPPWDLF